MKFPGLVDPRTGVAVCVHGNRPLAYLDNASTTHKPKAVLDAVMQAYLGAANVHRGVHSLSQRATARYEGARDLIRDFVGAEHREEVIFCRGATEAVNLVAQTWGRAAIGAGDTILVSEMEHHSNLVPWQMLAEERGASVAKIPIDETGALALDALASALAPGRVKLVAVTHVSNSLGTVNDIAAISALAHRYGAKVMVDGAQAAAHLPLDVVGLGCDFYALSAHKFFGPTGIGVLYGRREWLESAGAWQGGGDMILSVTFEGTEFNALPHRLEAGTPHIAGAIGMGAAVEWLGALDATAVRAHEEGLRRQAEASLADVAGLRIIGRAPDKAPVVSFVVDDIHPHDLGTVLDLEGVAVRTGHHCTQPVMDRFLVDATVRVSFAAYNTEDEIERLVVAVNKAVQLLRG
ncbi:MAG: cysteine desulfurase [Myxococcota bacterium]